jgi:hypothetical protein
MKKIEKAVGEHHVHWTLTDALGTRVDVSWAYGCPNAVVLNYEPRHSDHTCAVLPMSMLDELVTLSRNRPELEIDPLRNPVEELGGDPQSRAFGGDRDDRQSRTL